MPKLSADRINDLVRAYFEREWARVNETAWQISDDTALDPEHEYAGTKLMEADLRLGLAKQKIDPATLHDVKAVLKNAGAEDLSPLSDEYHQLGLGVLRARIEATRLLAATLEGRTEELRPKDPLFDGIVVTHMPPTDGSGQGADTRLQTLIETYCDLKRTVSSWSAQTETENRRALTMFKEFAGPQRQVADIKMKDIRDFRNLLAKLPKAYRTSPEYKGVPIGDVPKHAKSDTLRLSVGSQTKYFGPVRTFFDWLEREGHVDHSPVRRIGVEGKKRSVGEQRRFKPDEIKALFASPAWSGHYTVGRRSKPGKVLVRDGKFWVPLVGLYSGMRLGEIVQLLVSDIRRDGMTSYFDVNKGEGTKALKTESAVRQVPIHPRLTEIGFLEYVESRRKADPKERLFPDVTLAKKGQLNKPFSKWFSRYLKETGQKRDDLSFHGFRHAFIRALRDAKVPDSRIKAIVGHADKSVTAGYGGGFNVETLVGDLAAVNYDLDLAHLSSD